MKTNCLNHYRSSSSATEFSLWFWWIFRMLLSKGFQDIFIPLKPFLLNCSSLFSQNLQMPWYLSINQPTHILLHALHYTCMWFLWHNIWLKFNPASCDEIFVRHIFTKHKIWNVYIDDDEVNRPNKLIVQNHNHVWFSFLFFFSNGNCHMKYISNEYMILLF